MSETQRYSTLQDYLRVLRRRWVLIALTTAGVAAVALALSVTKEPTYEASAQVSFRDITEDLDLFVGGDSAGEPPAQRAAANAELITRPTVVRRVEREVGDELSSSELRDAISTRVGVLTNLVILTGKARTAELATDIANAYADAAQEVGTEEVKEQLATFEQAAQREVVEAQNSKQNTFSLVALQDRLSRIRTLQAIAEPVTIASRATEPSSPVSPRPGRDTVLGAMLGLIFGLLAAFIRDSLDRRLHGSQEAHHELGAPVLGRVPETALGYPGLAMNGRVAMAEDDFEAFRVLRTNLGFLAGDNELKTILVTSGLPEEGKSTVSMSLSSAFVIAGRRVLLIECDLRRPSFARRLGVNPEPGLTNYLLGNAGPRDVLQTVDLAEPGTWNTGASEKGERSSEPSGTLVCIAAGSGVARPAELLVTDRFKHFLATVRKAYDVVILDGSPLLSVVDPLELVPQVDGVLVCIRAEKTTRDELRAARTALGNLPERPMGAVMTGLRRGGPDSYDYYYGY